MPIYASLMDPCIKSATTVLSSNYFQNAPLQQEIKSVGDLETYSGISTNTICQSCRSNSAIFDEQAGETICTDCATVISDRQAATEKKPNSKDEMGQPTSLVFPDKGLSTVITFSNRDANGTSLNQDQIHSVNKIRYYDKLSDSKNHIRNLKNAFAVMAGPGISLHLPTL